MGEKFKGWLITIIIVVILAIPIVIKAINNNTIKVRDIDYFINNASSSSFSLVYYGSTNKDDYKSYKDQLLFIKNKYKIDVYTINSKKMTDEDKARLIFYDNEFKNENVYVIISDGEIVYISADKIDNDKLDKIVNKYYNSVLPADEAVYKTVSTYKEYMKIVNSKKATMAVFGRNSCGWCNKFKIVYNEIAAKYNVDIYYFDSDSFDSNEYSKILNSGLMIPAKCTKAKTSDLPLSSGFGTPLTLITKEGKTVDCISGYTNSNNLYNLLKDNGIIK